MFGHYLLNKNEGATVAPKLKFRELNMGSRVSTVPSGSRNRPRMFRISAQIKRCGAVGSGLRSELQEECQSSVARGQGTNLVGCNKNIQWHQLRFHLKWSKRNIYRVTRQWAIVIIEWKCHRTNEMKLMFFPPCLIQWKVEWWDQQWETFVCSE